MGILENAKEVGAVMDGSNWLQGFTDYHCPGDVQILDFPHAGEHISPIGEFLWGKGTPEMKQWVGESLHQLKHEGPAGLLAEFCDPRLRTRASTLKSRVWQSGLSGKTGKPNAVSPISSAFAGQLAVALSKVGINGWSKFV